MKVVCYHGDFDGCVSATIVYDYLKNKVPFVCLEPVDYYYFDEWLNKEYKYAEMWIVDFEDHFNSSFWFDHHDRSKRSKITNSVSIVDPSYRSCGRLVFDKLRELFDYRNDSFTRLTALSDVLDSCSFSFPEDVYADTSEIKLYWILNDIETSNSFRNFVIDILYTFKGDIDILNDFPRFRNQWDIVKYKIERGVELLKNNKKIKEFDDNTKLLFCEIPDSKSILCNGVLSSSCYPDVDYHLLVSKFDNMYKVSFSRGIFSRNNKIINIGKIMKNFGGGGHKDNGAVVVNNRKLVLDIIGKLMNKISTEHNIEPHLDNSIQVFLSGGL